jgi:hypothetical protein
MKRRIKEHEADKAGWSSFDYEKTTGVPKGKRKEMEQRRIKRKK